MFRKVGEAGEGPRIAGCSSSDTDCCSEVFGLYILGEEGSDPILEAKCFVLSVVRISLDRRG